MTIKLWIFAATVLTTGVIFPAVVYWLVGRDLRRHNRENDPFRRRP